jgi:hypothetical protein
MRSRPARLCTPLLVARLFALFLVVALVTPVAVASSQPTSTIMARGAVITVGYAPDGSSWQAIPSATNRWGSRS